MKVYVRTSGSIHEGDFICTGVFPTLKEAQESPGGACANDKSWDFEGNIEWRDKVAAPTWRREWGDDRDDIEEHDLILPQGYVMVWDAHLRQVIAHARTYDRRPTETAVAYPADLPGAVKAWEERKYAIDHVQESPVDVAHGEAIREEYMRNREYEQDLTTYRRLHRRFNEMGITP